MQHALRIVREQMMGQIMLRQVVCDILCILNVPFQAIHRTLRNAVLQNQCSRFTAIGSDDLRAVCQEIGQPFQGTAANSKTMLHDVVQDPMVDCVECGR